MQAGAATCQPCVRVTVQTSACDFLAQIHAAPAHHLVALGVGPFHTKRRSSAICASFSGGGRPGPTRNQPGQALRVVAMHPVTQRLPVHAVKLRRLVREWPSRISAIASRRRTTAPSRVRPASSRNSDAECSSRVISIGLPIPGTPLPCRRDTQRELYSSRFWESGGFCEVARHGRRQALGARPHRSLQISGARWFASTKVQHS